MSDIHSDVGRKARRAFLVTRVFWGFIGSVVVVSLIATCYGVWLIRSQQVTNTKTSLSTQQLLSVVEDCLNPGGHCYKRSQDNQAHVLQQVTSLFTYAELCGNSGNATNLPALKRCVNSLIERNGLG